MLINRLEMSKHNKQVVMLYFATIAGTLFGFVASVINTYNLDVVPYGDLRYTQNIIQFLSVVVLFGYFSSGSRLLAISNDEKYSRKIKGAMVLILTVSSLLLMIGTLIAGLLLSHKNNTPYLFLASIPVCFYPLLTNYFNTTAQGDNDIGRLSLVRLLPSLVYVPIAYFIFKKHEATSISVMLLQWGIYSFLLICILISTRPSFKNLKRIFFILNKENKEYGIQLYYGSLAMVATNYLAGITLGLYNENNANVGFYTLALTLTTPLSYLPGIVGTSYFKQFANQDSIPLKVIKYTLLLTLISCVVFVLLIRPVVDFLYRESYYIVGTYASWLAIGFCIHGLGDMLNRFLGSHGQGVAIRNASFSCGIIKIFGYIVLVYFFDINGALITNIVSSIIYCLVLVHYYRRFVSISGIKS